MKSKLIKKKRHYVVKFIKTETKKKQKIIFCLPISFNNNQSTNWFTTFPPTERTATRGPT